MGVQLGPAAPVGCSKTARAAVGALRAIGVRRSAEAGETTAANSIKSTRRPARRTPRRGLEADGSTARPAGGSGGTQSDGAATVARAPEAGRKSWSTATPVRGQPASRTITRTGSHAATQRLGIRIRAHSTTGFIARHATTRPPDAAIRGIRECGSENGSEAGQRNSDNGVPAALGARHSTNRCCKAYRATSTSLFTRNLASSRAR